MQQKSTAMEHELIDSLTWKGFCCCWKKCSETLHNYGVSTGINSTFTVGFLNQVSIVSIEKKGGRNPKIKNKKAFNKKVLKSKGKVLEQQIADYLLSPVHHTVVAFKYE